MFCKNRHTNGKRHIERVVFSDLKKNELIIVQQYRKSTEYLVTLH